MHVENVQITFDEEPKESRKRKSYNKLTIREEKLTRFQDNIEVARRFSSAVSYTKQAKVLKGKQSGLAIAVVNVEGEFQELDQRKAARDAQIDAQTELFQEVYHLQKTIDSSRGRTAAVAVSQLNALSGEELYDDTIGQVREQLVDDKKLEKQHQQARKVWKEKLHAQKQASERYNSLKLRAQEEEAAGDELVIAAQMGESPDEDLDDIADIAAGPAPLLPAGGVKNNKIQPAGGGVKNIKILPTSGVKNVKTLPAGAAGNNKNPLDLDDILIAAKGGVKNIKMEITSAGSSPPSRAGSQGRSTTPPKSRAQAPEREPGEVYMRDLRAKESSLKERSVSNRNLWNRWMSS